MGGGFAQIAVIRVIDVREATSAGQGGDRPAAFASRPRRVVQRRDFAAGVGKRRLRASGRSRIVANLRIRVPPIGREPRQPDLADQSKANLIAKAARRS